MPPRMRGAVTVLDLAAKDNGADSDEESDDLQLSSLLISQKEKAERVKDAQFVNDDPSDSKSPRHNVQSSDEDAPEEPKRRTSGRLRKTNSSVLPPIVQPAQDFDFGSSSSSDSKSGSTESHPSPSPKTKKKKKPKKRKDRSHQTSKSRSKSKKKQRKPGLYKLVGKSNITLAKEHNNGVAYEENVFGFYDSWSDGDLPIADFERCHVWMREEAAFHSLGRERGENMGKLHNQGHLGMMAPYTEAGCKALTQKYKEDLVILTHSRRKVQFKLLVGDQPEDKMCAYTRKWRGFQEFRFHSSDRNGDEYTEEYLDHCDDKYRVMRLAYALRSM